MAGVGVYGGYQPAIVVPEPVPDPGIPLDYPPGPVAWSAGQAWPLRSTSRVYANDLNLQLSQPVAFLARKPMFQGAQTQATQSIPASSWTPIILDTETADPWFMHLDSGDFSQIQIPTDCDGIWLVQGSVPQSGIPTGNYIYGAGVMHNGSVYSTGEYLGSTGSSRYTPGMADLIAVSGNDYLQLAAYQNYGTGPATYMFTGNASGQLYDTAYPVFTARWVAANNSLPGGVLNGITLGVPNPGTWTTLQEATSAQFNSDIRNSVLFLANVPAARVAATGSPASIPSGTSSQVTGLAETIDNWAAYSSNTWTCPVSGLYLVGGVTAYNAQSSAFLNVAQIKADQSGTVTTYSGASSYAYWSQATVLRVLRFTAGDTAQLWSLQISGSSLTPATNSRLFTLWLSS